MIRSVIWDIWKWYWKHLFGRSFKHLFAILPISSGGHRHVDQRNFQQASIYKRHLYILATKVAILSLYHIISNVAKPDIVKEVPYVRTVTVGKETVDNTSSYPWGTRSLWKRSGLQVAGKNHQPQRQFSDRKPAISDANRPQRHEQNFEASQATNSRRSQL